MTHSKKIMRNSLFMFISRIITIVLGFVIRKIFIYYLGAELLGLNSLYADLLGFLNLADMGLGIAVQYNLYKPIADGDNAKINSILNATKKIYNIVGFSIIFVGCILSVFLQYFIKDNPFDLSFLRTVFILNVISSASTYFFVHKRLFLCAKEDMHITNLVDMLISLSASILKAVSLILFANYYVFTIIGVVQAFGSNAMLSVVCNKKYTGISKGKVYQKEDMKLLLGNIKELLPNKIGSFVFSNTDNLIISIFLGLTMVTCYTNYFSITNHLFMIAAMMAGIIKVSFGNMLQEDRTEEEHLLFLSSYQMLQFFYSSICGVALLCLLNPFVEMWYGKAFIMPVVFSVVLTLDFYVHSMYQPLSMMLEARGAFKTLKNQQIIAVILNLLISIGLVHKVGILGPIVGTLCVDILTMMFRIYSVIYLYYKSFLKKYICMIVKYMCVFLLEYGLIYCSLTVIELNNDFVGVMLKGMLVCSCVCLLNIAIFYKTSEFKYIISRFRKREM